MLKKLKEMKTIKKMKDFENASWDAEWEQVVKNRENNPNRKNEVATEWEKEVIYKKLKGEN